MKVTRGMSPRAAGLLVVMLVLAGCQSNVPEPSPYPTTAPRAPVDTAESTAGAFAQAWADADWDAMYRMIAARDRQTYSRAQLRRLLSSFGELAGVTALDFRVGSPLPVTLPPEPPPPDLPAPTPASPLPAASATPGATPTGSPSPSPTPVPPDTPLDGPVPALAVALDLEFTTDNFGSVDLERELILVQGADGWQVRWSPELLFPELGPDASLELEREAPTRGRIIGSDGTVWARNRPDGTRVYPQEWLAGHTIGYATPASRRELGELVAHGARQGDLLGRAGLELGADEVLRGRAGFTLSAVPSAGEPEVVLERPVAHGADIVITLRPALQRTAEDALSIGTEAGTAVVDPDNGDVWVLASMPRFNPNAMTLGTTLAGVPLAAPTDFAITNHAVDGTYPTGSSFKVFTLAAALQTGVAGPATRMTCSPTWPFSGFTFRNYMNHSLPGLVDLLQAMAFSCNTTYMPLSIMVYEEDERALPRLVGDFGFGKRTGMRYLPHSAGINPNHAYFNRVERWHGDLSPYGPFDQIQLSIGQGSLLASPLQVANAYAAIGNGGRLWVPRIVAEIRDPDGSVQERIERELIRRIPLTRRQLAYVVDSMEAVVNYPYGTGRAAFVGFGVPVAGKSGTAETGGPNPNAWFPAIAPANNPRISVATVLVRFPLGTGGDFAAPLVRRVMGQFFAR
jgi:penicillin-binding protein 2